MIGQGDGLTFDLITDGWEAFVKDLLRCVERDEGKLVRKIAIDFVKAVIPKTPVDQGRARAGWQSYLLDQGMPIRISGRNVTEQAVVEGTAEGTFREEFSRDDAFVEIINGVSYIIYLEYGSSDQAPAGMVRITFREFEASEKLTKEYRAMLRDEIAEANKAADAAARRALHRPYRMPVI